MKKGKLSVSSCVLQREKSENKVGFYGASASRVDAVGQFQACISQEMHSEKKRGSGREEGYRVSAILRHGTQLKDSALHSFLTTIRADPPGEPFKRLNLCPEGGARERTILVKVSSGIVAPPIRVQPAGGRINTVTDKRGRFLINLPITFTNNPSRIYSTYCKICF